MKATAPDKIYLEAIYPDNGVLPNGLNYTPSPTDIEYTRTDAFIEKACEFIEQSVTGYIDVTHKGGDENITLQSEFVNDFKEFMKGE